MSRSGVSVCDLDGCGGHDIHCGICSTQGCATPRKDHIFSYLTLELSIMGSCRQLYEECHQHLWTTNTFSFNTPRALEFFLRVLNLAQKKKLKKIAINARYSEMLSKNHDRKIVENLREWGLDSATSAIIGSLRGVCILYLRVIQSHSFPERLFGEPLKSERIIQGTRRALASFRGLRTLQLRQAFVAISYNNITWETPCVQQFNALLADDNCQLAQEFRTQLLDANGAELVKYEELKDEQEKVKGLIADQKAKIEATEDRLEVLENNILYARRNLQHEKKLAAETPASNKRERRLMLKDVECLEKHIEDIMLEAPQCEKRLASFKQELKRLEARCQKVDAKIEDGAKRLEDLGCSPNLKDGYR